IRKLRERLPSIDIAAMPVVGEGNAYRRLDVPIVGPTKTMPSGGFTYVDRWLLWKDIQAGLLTTLWKQLMAVRRYAPTCDLVFTTGDVVGQAFSYFCKNRYVSFISPMSALYEGELKPDPFLRFFLSRERCLTVITRDPPTAVSLQKQGLSKAIYGGIPSLDYLVPTGKDIQQNPDIPAIALLPGSRLPEAIRNFKLQLQLAEDVFQLEPPETIQFYAALVPGVMSCLADIAHSMGWQLDGESGVLTLSGEGDRPRALVRCYSDAFNDIVCGCTLVVGMAGLAVDQAVALGKPVIQIAGEGPQFSYAFAEAQDRLLGLSAQTIGTEAATPEILTEAAQRLVETVRDTNYLEACVANGRERLGTPGASERIVNAILRGLGELPSE
ncbi:MAG: lipid-A-disaccharide synthase-related protein, partial [Cyanobacteria bacterium P01_G01_bin.4]